MRPGSSFKKTVISGKKYMVAVMQAVELKYFVYTCLVHAFSCLCYSADGLEVEVIVQWFVRSKLTDNQATGQQS